MSLSCVSADHPAALDTWDQLSPPLPLAHSLPCVGSWWRQ